MSHRSLTGAIWQPVDVQASHLDVARTAPVSQAAARCMAIRCTDRVPPNDWLNPTRDHLHDPFAMLGMHAAVDRLQQAVRDGQRVRIITDYDVDGTTSSLILQATLRMRRPDLQLDFHIPNRFGEGYGFSVVAAQQAAADGVQLIVTADIGVRDHAAVDAARDAGIDVLICDHHLPSGESVPANALVLCPPQAGCTYPNPQLAACGVSLKLATAMLSSHSRFDAILASLLKLAAIGTVADLVKLHTLENRAIVALGLQSLNSGRHHAGLAALLQVSGSQPGRISETDLGYRIGPRINAAGRVADAKLVIDLLNCRDAATATTLAERLDALNRDRRDIQKRLVKDALQRVGDSPPPFIVVAGDESDGWHRGVVGIVASRLKDEFHRPVAVVSIQGDHAVGSMRSIPGVHAVTALASADPLLVKYGGHPAAAGFTVPTQHLDALRQALCDYVTQHTQAQDLVPVRRVDVSVQASELGPQLVQELAALGPFGMGNPRPRLMVPGVHPVAVRSEGDGSRLKGLLPRDGGGGIDLLWWGRGDLAPALKDGPVDLLGTLEINEWRGRRNLQFKLDDARSTTA